MSYMLLSSCLAVDNLHGPRQECDPQHGVEVIVDNPEHSGSMEGARVFVLGSDGKELASALADSLGRAKLPCLDDAKAPKFILVEKDYYFLGGLRWESGMLQYYSILQQRALR